MAGVWVKHMKGTCNTVPEQQSFAVVQWLRCVWLFEIPQTAARPASLSFTLSHSWLKLMSIELAMPSYHLILSPPLLLMPSIFPSVRIFSPMKWFFTSGGQSIGASASILSINIRGWFPLTGCVYSEQEGMNDRGPMHSRNITCKIQRQEKAWTCR